MTKEIIEKNRLIAEFMGAKPCTDYYGTPDTHVQFNENEVPEKFTSYPVWHNQWLKYNKSWDWLMPVVEKIESTPQKSIRVQISGYLCDIIQTKRDPSKKENGGFEDILLVSNKHNDKIFLVWKSVVEFIKLENR